MDQFFCGMDVVDIFKIKSDPDNYYGVYHAVYDKTGDFRLMLAKSKDGLTNWTRISNITEYASMGKIWTDPKSDHIIMAYEYTNHTNGGGNNIRVELFEDINALVKFERKDQIDINRTLGAINEGTPSFEEVEFDGKSL